MWPFSVNYKNKISKDKHKLGGHPSANGTCDIPLRLGLLLEVHAVHQLVCTLHTQTQMFAWHAYAHFFVRHTHHTGFCAGCGLEILSVGVRHDDVVQKGARAVVRVVLSFDVASCARHCAFVAHHSVAVACNYAVVTDYSVAIAGYFTPVADDGVAVAEHIIFVTKYLVFFAKNGVVRKVE
jgi:hypothetical protein